MGCVPSFGESHDVSHFSARHKRRKWPQSRCDSSSQKLVRKLPEFQNRYESPHVFLLIVWRRNQPIWLLWLFHCHGPVPYLQQMASRCLGTSRCLCFLFAARPPMTKLGKLTKRPKKLMNPGATGDVLRAGSRCGLQWEIPSKTGALNGKIIRTGGFSWIFQSMELTTWGTCTGGALVEDAVGAAWIAWGIYHPSDLK